MDRKMQFLLQYKDTYYFLLHDYLTLNLAICPMTFLKQSCPYCCMPCFINGLNVVLALGRNLHLEAYTSLHISFPIELIRFSFDAIHRSSEFLNVSLSSSLYVRYSAAYRHGWYVSLRPWALWHYARGGEGLFCDNVYYRGIARRENV